MKNSQKLRQVNFNFEEINHRATKIMNSYLYMVNIIMTHFASTKFISIKYIKFKNSQEFHRLYLAFPIGRFRASKNQDPLHFCTSNKNVHKLLLYIKWNDSTFNIITVIDKVNSSNHIGLGAPHGYIALSLHLASLFLRHNVILFSLLLP